jgi:hypothetical protein
VSTRPPDGLNMYARCDRDTEALRHLQDLRRQLFEETTETDHVELAVNSVA